MFNHLQIYDSRERLMVGCADTLLGAYAAASRWVPSRRPAEAPRRILLLRLERIGDFLMTLAAIQAVRHRAPSAHVHLVVGGWNASLARLVPWVDAVETLDVPWLSRKDAGLSASALARQARAWRAQEFDLAINFEPDIRSNLLLNLSGAARRVGFVSGGGGAMLTDALTYDTRSHTSENALRLVDTALPLAPTSDRSAIRHARLTVPEDARQAAARMLATVHDRPLVGFHASAGRKVKQWHMDRFAQVATKLARELSATIVLTGTPDDRPLVNGIRSLLPPDVHVLDLAEPMELPVFAALLEQLQLLVTCDTGPMHLAAAVGTRVVALFGPSDPRRYGPLTDRARVMTADLWCHPCNRVRRPPERCANGVPECMDAIDVDSVYLAAREMLAK